MKKSTVNGRIAYYLYNAGGERTVKKEVSGNEVLYADKLYQVKVNMNKDCITRHIFVGDTRIVSSVTFSNLTHDDTVYKQGNYFYHGDHLGSSNFISDYQGNEYEHIEYAPYGETWIEESKDSNDYITYKFSGKELDDETGLIYFGARYYDNQTSRWMSADPIYDGIKEGFGIYTYCRNNPLKYTDPTGLAANKKQDGGNHPYKDRDSSKENNIKDLQRFKDLYKQLLINKNPNLKKGQPMIKGEYGRITDDNNRTHKGRTFGGTKKNIFVSDYAGAIGSKEYATDEMVVNPKSLKWYKNNKEWSEKTILDETVNTQGVGWGFYLEGKSPDGKYTFIYAHQNPDSDVAKIMLEMQDLALKIGIKEWIIPRSALCGEIGNNGTTTGPHLHYEKNRD